ncbi:MAG: histidinol-phosphate aminotransferase family protein [Oscillospiraceae bacterium]|nr:histidinol-phosphate aminotransferase family protein [Oscillospiraceae bacterium]
MQPKDFLNPKIKKLPPYSLNSEVDLSNIKIKLDANESFLELPGHIQSEALAGLHEIKFNRYPDPSAASLIKKFADYLNARENTGLTPDNIAAGNGTDELLNIIINAFVSKNDKMLVFEPDFSMYAFYGQIIEAGILRLQKKDLKINWSEAADVLKRENIKLALFSNPCNPTGQLENKADIIKFINLARECGAVVVLDEVYMSFCGGRNSLLHEFLEYPNLIIMKSLSKSIGLAALRVGFALSNADFINAVKTIKSPFNLNAVSQKLAETVLGYPDYLEENLKTITQNKKELQEELSKIFTVHPTETNFVLAESAHSGEIFEYLLKNGILVRKLSEKYLRITSGSAEENKELLKCLKLKYQDKPKKQK